MSADEKKNTMLKLISSSESVFNKDELEKKGDKAGVVMKTVMDAVKELCAERLVETDKIRQLQIHLLQQQLRLSTQRQLLPGNRDDGDVRLAAKIREANARDDRVGISRLVADAERERWALVAPRCLGRRPEEVLDRPCRHCRPRNQKSEAQ